jgi:hypothetical protein
MHNKIDEICGDYITSQIICLDLLCKYDIYETNYNPRI